MTNVDPERWLDEALTCGENEQVEFKQRVVAETLARLIAAFANTHGGTIVVGVDDGGRVVGTDPRQVEQAALAARAQLDPQPPIQVTGIQREDKAVALIQVAEISNGPVLNEGRAYGRVGASVVPLTQDKIVRLAHRSSLSTAITTSPEAALAQEIGRLAAAISKLTEREDRLTALEPAPSARDRNLKVPDRVAHVLQRFHALVTTLSRRQRQRPPLLISDEYDLQYLLHALLRVDFDDVRPEEWTPSFAGSASRMDFLLKREGTVVECKLAKEGRGDREIADELLIDIGRYQTHPDCKILVCFVYDPGSHIMNIVGLEDDFTRRSTDQFLVRTIIAPRIH